MRQGSNGVVSVRNGSNWCCLQPTGEWASERAHNNRFDQRWQAGILAQPWFDLHVKRSRWFIVIIKRQAAVRLLIQDYQHCPISVQLYSTESKQINIHFISEFNKRENTRMLFKKTLNKRTQKTYQMYHFKKNNIEFDGSKVGTIRV